MKREILMNARDVSLRCCWIRVEKSKLDWVGLAGIASGSSVFLRTPLGGRRLD
jgi:hypothetical protein